MKINSDTANKLIKNYKAEIEALLILESQGTTYSYAPGEEPIIPEYSFRKTQEELHSLEEKTLRLSHAVAVFNSTTVLPEYSVTLDEAIGRMSRLNEEKKRLYALLQIPEKKRERSYGGGDADITCRNFDQAEVRAAYNQVTKDLMALQQAINIANLTQTFEVDL
ncbi:MAG: hypothetical protein II713_04890 [Clostridia bacterium]|nr:hypothetical protein [Clostridia bacterium]